VTIRFSDRQCFPRVCCRYCISIFLNKGLVEVNFDQNHYTGCWKKGNPTLACYRALRWLPRVFPDAYVLRIYVKYRVYKDVWLQHTNERCVLYEQHFDITFWNKCVNFALVKSIKWFLKFTTTVA
jgi:hypothetical protein